MYFNIISIKKNSFHYNSNNLKIFLQNQYTKLNFLSSNLTVHFYFLQIIKSIPFFPLAVIFFRKKIDKNENKLFALILLDYFAETGWLKK